MTLTDIPEELRKADQWVLWRAERGTKVPYQVAHPQRKASTIDPSQWASFADAIGRDIPGMGLGYVFSGDGEHTGIDLDACRDPETGEIESWAQAIIANLDSYTEVSPSKTGVKVWVRAVAPANTKRTVYPDKPAWAHGKARAIEMYDRGRYFAVTGEHVDGTPATINPAQDALEALYEFYWPEAEGELALPAMAPTPNSVPDEELLRLAFRSRNGEAIRRLYVEGDTALYAGDDSSADLALSNHLAFYTGNDAARMDRLFRHSALMRPKWDSPRGSTTWGALTIANAIAHTTQVYTPSVTAIGTFTASSATVTIDQSTGEILTGPQEIDWQEFWKVDDTQAAWLVEPFLPRGRSIALVAPAKAGKSLLSLEIAYKLATGQAVLDTPAGPPQHVLYADYEMSSADLMERLEALGATADTDLSHLHYYLLPDLGALDTPQGGAAMLAVWERHRSVFVVIDTTSRVLSLNENDSESILGLYRYTILPLKAQGVTTLRLDHLGKQVENGARGSSAKSQDVDLVWVLKAVSSGVELTATHRRQGWIPETISLERVENPHLTHQQTERLWSLEARAMAAQIDQRKLPVDVSNRTAAAALRADGVPVRNGILAEALRLRVFVSRGNTPGNGSFGSTRLDSGDTREQTRERAGNGGSTAPANGGTQPPPIRGAVVPQAQPQAREACRLCYVWVDARFLKDGICPTCARISKEQDND